MDIENLLIFLSGGVQAGRLASGSILGKTTMALFNAKRMLEIQYNKDRLVRHGLK